MKKQYLILIMCIVIAMPILFLDSCAKDQNLKYDKIKVKLNFKQNASYYCSLPSTPTKFVQEKVAGFDTTLKTIDSKQIPGIYVRLSIPADIGGWVGGKAVNLGVSGEYLTMEVPTTGDFVVDLDYYSYCTDCGSADKSTLQHEVWNNAYGNRVYKALDVWSSPNQVLQIDLDYQGAYYGYIKEHLCKQ